MRRSRFVALYVSDLFIDSPWCRAEYLNACWVEGKYNIPRALVICESNAAIARVPEPLKGVRQFALAQAGERDLAEFVVSGNSVRSETARKLVECVPKERLAHDVSPLSLEEQLNLLEQRTLFWIERGAAEIHASKTERRAVGLSHLMFDSITEVETIFREVCSIAFVSGASSRLNCGIHEAELNRVITMAKAVVDAYSHPTREELRGLDKWAHDFVLRPLLLAVELQDTRSEAARVYRDLCLALLRGEFAHEVPVYLSVVDAVEGGQETASAIAHHRVALAKAQLEQQWRNMKTY